MISVVWCIATLVLAEELAMADNQCAISQLKSPILLGGSSDKNTESHSEPGYYWILSMEYYGANYIGSSCKKVCKKYPETCDKPGYYRIKNKWTYCCMKEISAIDTGDFIPTCAGVGGGWKRIVNIDMSAGDVCPGEWFQGTHSGVSFCYKTGGRRTCSSSSFSTNGTSYQRVCGRARGYQKGYTTGFANTANLVIDNSYADGLLITYGNPRQHIWSYVAGIFDNRSHGSNCPCAASGRAPPPFVGTDYYCESGAADKEYTYSVYHFNDPLWDGSSCIASNCCTNPTQPWFYQELNEATSSDIEARICGYNSLHSAGALLIDLLELYIQ